MLLGLKTIGEGCSPLSKAILAVQSIHASLLVGRLNFFCLTLSALTDQPHGFIWQTKGITNAFMIWRWILLHLT